nr:MAG TPA: hypothetical protein [Bacteriophage sp.]
MSYRYICSKLIFLHNRLILFAYAQLRRCREGGVYNIPDTPSQSSEQSKIEKTLSDTQPSIFSKKQKRTIHGRDSDCNTKL